MKTICKLLKFKIIHEKRPSKSRLSTYLFSIIFSGFVWISSQAQPDSSQVIVYHQNGKVMNGILLTAIFGATEFRIEVEGRSRRISTRKVDSLYINEEKYFVQKSLFKPFLLRKLDRGLLNVFEVNEDSIGIQRDNKELMLIPPNKYVEALEYLGYDRQIEENISKSQFVDKIKDLNHTWEAESIGSVQPLDSIMSSVRKVTGRFSVFRPAIGADIKVFETVSWFTSIGLNFGGEFFRDAQTYINYDLSSELRWFYSRKRRISKGKNIYNFSGPFMAGTYKYFIDINRENKDFVGLLHGWQNSRVFFDNSYVGYRLGLGYGLNIEEVMFYSELNIGMQF